MKKIALLSLICILSLSLIAAIPAKSLAASNAEQPGIHAGNPTGNGSSNCYMVFGRKVIKCSDLKKYYSPIQGEATMMKVTYFRYMIYGAPPNWNCVRDYNGYFRLNCRTYYYTVKEFKMPFGCSFRYQY